MNEYTDIKRGLTEGQVAKNKEQYGTNALFSNNKNSFFSLLLESFADPIIKILLIALAIKTIFLFKNFDWYETLGIVIAILVSSLISTISEYGSEKAFARMQEEASLIKCRVKREGQIIEVPIDQVVVGDIVLLSSGDKIPADGILVDGEISVDESTLNGEAKEKYKEKVRGSIRDNNLIYRGTVVYSKSGLMQVTKVGNDTVYGKLALEVAEKQPDSPLKLRLAGLAKIISKIGYIGAFLVSISYLFSVIFIQNNFNFVEIKNMITNLPVISGHILYALTLCVTVIVVSVPEGLPMMITLVLSSNMKRMLKDNVLVRKMVGIETAGSLNILFTDKTGTLTKGKLEVVGFLSGDLEYHHSLNELKQRAKLYSLVEDSILYNTEAAFSENKVIGGNITDRALLNFIGKKDQTRYQRLNFIPFDSKNKYTVATINKDGKTNLIKGAFEKILPNCRYYFTSYGSKKNITNRFNLEQELKKITQKGIRVLALAQNNSNSSENVLQESILLGFILIKDEIRKEAIEGVKLVQGAGINVVMITGDNKDTATTIAKEAGIITGNSDLVLTSDELNRMTDEEIIQKLSLIKVIARAFPQDKSRLVKLSQHKNLVVGMTGDGVNDAPALKKADVGFAMGSGTEVAKEASDIVILDDNFLSISKAILFGRTIFKSIRKFIVVQLTINLCALTLSIFGPFIGIETPVTVIQMLWINMVMDTLAGLAFAFEPPLRRYMEEKPKAKDEPIINSYMFHQILITGIFSSLLCLLFLKSPFIANLYREDPNNQYLMTAFFGLFIFIDVFNIFNARTERINILANITKNKVFFIIVSLIVIIQVILIYFGGNVFRTAGLTAFEFQIMILIAFLVIPFDLIRKKMFKRNHVQIGV